MMTEGKTTNLTMNKINYVDGDLIQLAKNGMFDVIAHGCNCMSVMANGIAPRMAEEFGCNNYALEKRKGEIDKLGRIEGHARVSDDGKTIIVYNLYTQYSFATPADLKPLDYDALTLCLKKLVMELAAGMHIGLPKIGCGLAGGDWSLVSRLIENILCKKFKVTVVNYKP